MLWWRIVGFTDQVLHEKIDCSLMDSEFNECRNRVDKVIPAAQLNQNLGNSV